MRSGMWGSERRFCILYLQAKEIQDRGPARRTATQCTRQESGHTRAQAERPRRAARRKARRESRRGSRHTSIAPAHNVLHRLFTLDLLQGMEIITLKLSLCFAWHSRIHLTLCIGGLYGVGRPILPLFSFLFAQGDAYW